MRRQDQLYEVQFDVILYEQVEEAELDKMRSFVQNKSNQRWLWIAIDHSTRAALAYTFGITMFYKDDWGSYDRNIDKENHKVEKTNTQRIELKNLTLRTRIKHLARKTICFSKLEIMHDIVIEPVINILEFA